MNTIWQATNVATAYAQQRRAIPDEARPTLPSVLVDIDGGQLVVIGFQIGESRKPGPPRPRRVCFPFFEVRVKLPGMEAAGKPIQGKDFGLEIAPGDYIGDLGDLLKFDLKTYKEKKERYYELLSDVAANTWLVPHAERSQEEISVASEMVSVLREIRENALEPYYRSTMLDLLKWLLAIGKEGMAR